MKGFYRFGLIFVLTITVFFAYQFIQVFYSDKSDTNIQHEELILSDTSKTKDNAATQTPVSDSNNRDTVAYFSKENGIDTKVRAIETANNAQILTCDTVYIIKEYDKTTKTEETIYEEIPEQYIGKTRRQMEEIAENYSQAPGLRDIEKGFASMEILSFSPEKLIVQKKYYSDLTKEHFYLVVENEYVTVYYSDLQTVYLYTDIYFANLSESLQQEILDKKYIESEEELYNFLESYTS